MDSGLGGLPYLQWIRQRKPHWNLIYLADNACFPYGIRSTDFLIDRLKDISRFIINEHNPDLCVIACNTASVTALDALRQAFAIPFVGVVPAVKPAAETVETGKIGVLATEKTVQGRYLEALIRQFAAGQIVETKAAPDLVRFVEEQLYRAEDSEVERILKPYIDHIAGREWSAVVLGCTHFILLKPWIEKMLPETVRIIDSTDGVGRRILSLIPDTETTVTGHEGIFYVTGKGFRSEPYQSAASECGMRFFPLEEL